MPAQKILAGRLSRDEMHARMFKATVYEIFRLEALKTFSRILLMAALLNSFLYSDACSQENVTPEQFTQDFDYLWSQLRDNYTYFDKKETDWNRVKEVYRPKVAEVRNEREFVTVLE